MKELTREQVAENINHIRVSNVRESIEQSEKAILDHDAALRARVRELEAALKGLPEFLKRFLDNQQRWSFEVDEAQRLLKAQQALAAGEVKHE